MWDDYDYYTPQVDQEKWDQARSERIARVENLIDFLLDLKVLRVPEGHQNLGRHWGYDTEGFVDRHWKV